MTWIVAERPLTSLLFVYFIEQGVHLFLLQLAEALLDYRLLVVLELRK